MKYLFLDSETTGLNPQSDEILSLCFCVYDYDENIFSYPLNMFFKPDHTDSWPEAQSVNGISPEDVSSSPSIRDYLSFIQEIVSSCQVVYAYNASFDLGFLEKLGIDFSSIKVIDPMCFYANIYNNGRWVSLVNCYKSLFGSLPPFTLHTATGDVRTLIQICTQLYPQSFRIDVVNAYGF